MFFACKFLNSTLWNFLTQFRYADTNFNCKLLKTLRFANYSDLSWYTCWRNKVGLYFLVFSRFSSVKSALTSCHKNGTRYQEINWIWDPDTWLHFILKKCFHWSGPLRFVSNENRRLYVELRFLSLWLLIDDFRIFSWLFLRRLVFSTIWKVIWKFMIKNGCNIGPSWKLYWKGRLKAYCLCRFTLIRRDNTSHDHYVTFIMMSQWRRIDPSW